MCHCFIPVPRGDALYRRIVAVYCGVVWCAVAGRGAAVWCGVVYCRGAGVWYGVIWCSPVVSCCAVRGVQL